VLYKGGEEVGDARRLCPSIICTEVIDGGKREKWNCGLITAKDEMERVAETKTMEIERNEPIRTLLLLIAGIRGRNMSERG
jgi:hypothetical protein